MGSVEAIYRDIMAALNAREGFEWKEAKGEVHPHYNEMPFWLLLYEDSDLVRAHDAFRSIVAPYTGRLADLQITVAYRRFSPDSSKMYFLDFFQTDQEIMKSYDYDSIGIDPGAREFDGMTVFDSRDSKR